VCLTDSLFYFILLIHNTLGWLPSTPDALLLKI